MACYKPIPGYLRKGGGWTPSKKESSFGVKMEISCGQCIGCRIMHAQGWAIRCTHEAQLYNDNCFITLTYDNDHLPPHGTLRKTDHQKFMKRLRKQHKHKTIRFFTVGEYGEANGRPHYHTLLFNHDFADKAFYTNRRNIPVWHSAELTKLWGHGRIEIGTLTTASAGYAARYALKKVNGAALQKIDTRTGLKKYEAIDLSTGEIVKLTPEYLTMSTKPGIGKGWWDKYKTDVYPDGFVVLDGKKYKVPDYYTEQYKLEQPDAYLELCDSRRDFHKCSPDGSPARLAVREQVKIAQTNRLKRGYEDGTQDF